MSIWIERRPNRNFKAIIEIMASMRLKQFGTVRSILKSQKKKITCQVFLSWFYRKIT